MIKTKCLAVLTVILLLSFSRFGLANGLTISLLLPLQKTYQASDTLFIKFELSNNSNQSIKVLKWQTPFENRFNANMFDIYINAQKVNYLGRLVKRGTPKAKDYITLSPGQTTSTLINLENGYDMAIAGDYDVTYQDRRLKYQVQLLSKQNNVQSVVSIERSQSLLVTLTDDRERVKKKILKSLITQPNLSSQLAKQTPTFANCSADRQVIVNNAIDEAEQIALIAKNDLNNAPITQRSSAVRYRTWFGSYNATRYNTINDNFSKISNALASQTIGIDCACADINDPASTYAYVTPSDPYNISVCGAFWATSLVGTNSQAGTLIHELSHFNILGGTDDDVYGTVDAQNLANTEPAQAIDNADNYEYFAENTPFLSMPNGVTPTVTPTNNISQALDTDLLFTNSGSVAWYSQTSTTYADNDAAQSGNINGNQQSCMQTMVATPSDISFYHKVSSEVDYDYLRFYIDDIEQSGKISGNVDWEQQSYTLNTSNSIIKWCYTKDISNNKGSDAAWVDKIVYTNEQPTTPTNNISQQPSGGSGGCMLNNNNKFDPLLLLLLLLSIISLSRNNATNTHSSIGKNHRCN